MRERLPSSGSLLRRPTVPILFVCEDDGDGIPVEDKERIFDWGFGKNTGFGLAISREILGITGITIRETGVPGKGARFEMAVPKGT
jgi:signal transduction histidine kinase